MIPACAASMGCLCAGHACGNPASDPCDTSERPKRKRRTKAEIDSAYRAAAKRMHHSDGECEIDEGAPVSRAKGNPDKGAYVQAWVWVPDADL